MNNITKTIMESLESYEEQFGGVYAGCDGCSASLKQAEEIKSHLLQSQIKVIEAVIGMIDGKIIILTGKDMSKLEADAFNSALEDQISSLNQVKESIQEALNK